MLRAKPSVTASRCSAPPPSTRKTALQSPVRKRSSPPPTASSTEKSTTQGWSNGGRSVNVGRGLGAGDVAELGDVGAGERLGLAEHARRDPLVDPGDVLAHHAAVVGDVVDAVGDLQRRAG